MVGARDDVSRLLPTTAFRKGEVCRSSCFIQRRCGNQHESNHKQKIILTDGFLYQQIIAAHKGCTVEPVNRNRSALPFDTPHNLRELATFASWRPSLTHATFASWRPSRVGDLRELATFLNPRNLRELATFTNLHFALLRVQSKRTLNLGILQ